MKTFSQSEVRDKTPRRAIAGPALLALTIALGTTAPRGDARAAEPAGDDSAETVFATEILPPIYFRSVHYQIDNEVRAKDYFYHFTVTSEFGNFDVASLTVLQKRIYEIEITASISTEFERRGLKFDRTPGGRRGVDSDVTDILTNPVGTAGKLLDNLRYNFDETFGDGERSERRPNPTPVTTRSLRADPDPHKRSAANQLGVDVYSSNARLQQVLAQLAKARSSGRLRDSVAPANPIKVRPTPFGTGLFDTRIASRLKNNSAAEINEQIDRTLETLGVDSASRLELLSHPAYSPRDALYLSEYLDLISSVGDVSVLVDGAMGARTEADAAAFINLVRMLAYFHLTDGKLETVLARSSFPVVLSRGNEIVVPLPVDFFPLNTETKSIVENLQEMRTQMGRSRVVFLLAGQATEQMRNAISSREMRIKERYSF